MANRYAIKSGNWSDASVWSATSGGAGGAGVPTSVDSVYLDRNYTISLTANAAKVSDLYASAGRLNMNAYSLESEADLLIGYISPFSGEYAFTLDMGTGTLIGNQRGAKFSSLSTIIPGTSLLLINQSFSNHSLITNNHTFNDVRINLMYAAPNSSYDFSITGSPTFRSLTIQSKNSAAHTVNFDDNVEVKVGKLILIGASSANRLRVQDRQGVPSAFFGPIGSYDQATTYGQYVDMGMYNGLLESAYIGSNSVADIDSGGWILQDPPKISTLVDPLTAAPASNPNWVITGSVVQDVSGHNGGGYTGGNTSEAHILSTGTFDMIDSELMVEVSSNGGLYGYGTQLFVNKTPSDLSAEVDTPMELGSLMAGKQDGSAWSENAIQFRDLVGKELKSAYYTDSDYEPLRYMGIKIGSDGAVRFRYSLDGVTWKTKTGVRNISADSLPLFRSVRVGLGNMKKITFFGTTYDGQTIGSVNPDLRYPLIDAKSATDAGFSGTDPYNSGTQVSYTVQSPLSFATNYYWRVRTKDPLGSDQWSDWSPTRKFTTQLTTPTVTTGSASNVSYISASVAGNITSDGGATVSERGVVYATTTNPTTANSKVNSGSGTGSFTAPLSVLSDGVTYYARAYAINSQGTSYGSQVSFTTIAITAPSVTSTSSASVTTNQAQLSGNVTNSNGAGITERGFVYATTSNPTTANSKKITAGTTGAYSDTITGLTSNTTYYWRAYAINSKGTSYGANRSFSTLPIPPTIQTGTVGSITTSGATINNSAITSNPDSQTITERGVVYATTTNPTTANSKVTGSGSPYTVNITGLTENVTYYARAYIIWSGGTLYGSQVTFKTQGRAITVPNLPANNASVSSVRPQLEFTGTDADADTITYQLQINNTADFTSPAANRLSASDPGFTNLTDAKTDPFFSGDRIRYTLQTDVPRGTDLYWRVRGQDSGSATWGEWTAAQKLTVATIAPSVTLNVLGVVTFESASIEGEVTYDGGSAVTERGAVYSTSPNPTIANSKVVSGSGTGTFVASMTGLTGSTKYYARLFATNSVGTSYSAQTEFETEQTPSAPTVITGAPVNTTDTTTEFNGSQVTLDGTQTITERGVVFSTNPNPTIDNRKIIASTVGLGTYNVGITGLDPETTYYARAYAVNSIGVGYGSEVSFVTAEPFVPDEGDGYWTWAPDGPNAVVGRSQATPQYSSVDLYLSDLDLVDGEDYTFYYKDFTSVEGEAAVVIQWYDGAIKNQETINPGEPFTFTYTSSMNNLAIRLFVTQSNPEPSNINAAFNDMYLAQESEFSGFVPFVQNGTTEIRIDNNWILDKRREDTIQNIFNIIEGLSWYPFDAKTTGLGWFEVGDMITIDNGEDQKKIVIWEHSLTLDGGITENIKAITPDKTETDYKKAGTITSSLKRTQISVDHNAQQILSLAEDVYSVDGVVNKKFSEIEQTIDGVITTVQSSGGVNLLKNSVMYAADNNGVPSNWTVSGAGTLVIQASPESVSAGGISGNSFTLIDKTVTQSVTVRQDKDFIVEAEKQYYSFSAKVKKNTVGSAWIKLSNRNEEHIIDLPDQTNYYWEDVRIEALLPKDDHYLVEIFSDADASLQVTDAMLTIGNTIRQWTQANGEAMNTSVSIDDSGMTIRSNAFRNDYTRVTALGFEVHKHDASGDRIFGFNGDETNVYKIKVDNQISMAPMRAVPINYGAYKGWAFTLSKDD